MYILRTIMITYYYVLEVIHNNSKCRSVFKLLRSIIDCQHICQVRLGVMLASRYRGYSRRLTIGYDGLILIISAAIL